MGKRSDAADPTRLDFGLMMDDFIVSTPYILPATRQARKPGGCWGRVIDVVRGQRLAGVFADPQSLARAAAQQLPPPIIKVASDRQDGCLGQGDDPYPALAENPDHPAIEVD